MTFNLSGYLRKMDHMECLSVDEMVIFKSIVTNRMKYCELDSSVSKR